jgi:hypothetical protein
MDPKMGARLVLTAAAILCLLVAPIAAAGAASGSGGPKANASASVKKQVKKLNKKFKQLQEQLEQVSQQPGPQGPPGPQGEQGEQGPPGPSTGPAGGDLTGNFPNPLIDASAVNSAKVANDSLGASDVDESDLDSSVLQRRVTDTCPDGESIQAIDATGTSVTCETVGGGGNPTGPAGGDLAGSYPNPDIAAGAISGGLGGEISDNTITDDDLAAAAQFNGSGAGGDLSGTYPNPDIAANAVGTNEVALDSLAAEDLALGSVGTGEVAVDSLGQSDLGADSVSTSEVAGNTPLGGSLTTNDLAQNSVAADEVATDAIGLAEIGANQVSSSEIGAAAVGPSEVNDDSLTANELATGSVGGDEVANDNTVIPALTGTDVEDNSLQGADIAENTLAVGPRSYADVIGSTADVDEVGSKGVSDADVSSAGTGRYCFDTPGGIDDTVVGTAKATTGAGNVDRIVTTVEASATGCPAGTDASAFVFDVSAGALVNADFFVHFDTG